MRKQLWAIPALILLALPSAAWAQAQKPTVTTFNVDILQAQPCVFKRQLPPVPQPPAGILFTGCRIAGTPGGDITHGDVVCRFVGNVLAFDPGPDGTFATFTGGRPAGTEAILQGIKLIKRVPLVAKCPDLFPGQEFIQTGLTGIRTFFPLKFTPPGTTFTLEVEFGVIRTAGPGRVPRQIQEVRVNRFNFNVVVTPQTLEWVVEALHCQPLGVCEVPCITDEDLFRTLVQQARDVAGAANVEARNTAIDVMEATIIRNCLFQPQLFQVTEAGQLIPCAIFAGQLPGDRTIGPFGFGIVDTVENPCCCKLITDLAFIKSRLVGVP